MRKIFLVLLAVIFMAALGVGLTKFLGSEDIAQKTEKPQMAAENTTTTSNDSNTANEIEIKPLEFSTKDVDSIWLVVNKQLPISLEYVPEGRRLVDVTARTDKSEAERSMRDDAATAMERMFVASAKDEILLLLGSGYRDSDLQNFYYSNYVAAYGQAEADKFSAKPGTSEHQTGLVGDVSPASLTCYLEICFATTPEGEWLRDNAHKYGFIIRYPEGKEEITGYQFEPWHLRYVGEQLAGELFESGQTMEEYFGLVGL